MFTVEPLTELTTLDKIVKDKAARRKALSKLKHARANVKCQESSGMALTIRHKK